MKYDYVNASNATIPHMAVVWGEGSVDPGETVFTVEMGDESAAVEVAVLCLVEEANQRGGCLLDGLIGRDITQADLSVLAQDIADGRPALVRPSKFAAADLDDAYKALFAGGPATLSELAASMAIKDLMVNWKAALMDGTPINALLHDVDQVIKHLQQFKLMCTEKPDRLDKNVFKSFLDSKRLLVADQAFTSYDFGSYCVQDQGRWVIDGESRYMKSVKASKDGGVKDAKLSFHALFLPGSIHVEECFALDLDTGFML